jgi:hypothetical protein
VQAFLSAGDEAVLQEVANGKIRIQSACCLNTLYYRMYSFLQAAVLLYCPIKPENEPEISNNTSRMPQLMSSALA